MTHRTARRTRLARALGAATTAVVLGATAACGGGSSEPSGSGSAPSSAGSASSSASAQPLTASDIGERLASGLKDAGSFRFTLRTVTGGQTSTGGGKVDVSGATPVLDSTISAGGQQVQVRVVDGLYYLKAPGLGGGAKWLKIDPKAGSGVGQLLGRLGAGSDPTQQLKGLTKASKVTAKGGADVDGTPTTRYDVAVPTSALFSSLGVPESLVKELPDSVQLTVYVDAQDRVRRQVSTLSLRGTTTTTTVTYSDFGTPVEVSAPPAGQTTDASSLPGLGG